MVPRGGLVLKLSAALLVAGVALGACGPTVVPPAPVARASGTVSASALTPSPPAALEDSPAPTFCAGRTWPPYPLRGIPGITAVSTDRATVALTNRTGRTYYYRLSAWQLDQFETCRAFGERERARGPIAPGATEVVMVDPSWQQQGLRATVALWDEPCGEGCALEPVAAMLVELSPVEPAAS